MRPPLAEALGTFFIVFVAAGLPVAAARAGVPGLASGIGAGLGAGLAYMAAALAFGRITTGHFNPALTVGLRAAGGFGGSLSFTLTGQIVGALLALAVVGGGAPADFPPASGGIGATLRLALIVGILTLVHVATLQMRDEAAPYATGAALGLLVALQPEGGPALVNAAHATASWLTGHGTPFPVFWLWVATILGATAAGSVWRNLREPAPPHDAPPHAPPHDAPPPPP
jgi:aquaporin Z